MQRGQQAPRREIRPRRHFVHRGEPRRDRPGVGFQQRCGLGLVQHADDRGIVFLSQRPLDQWQRTGIGRLENRISRLEPRCGTLRGQIEGSFGGLDREAHRIVDDDQP